MILSAQSIRRACVGPLFDDGTMARVGRPPMIEPFCERAVSFGMSFGLSSAGYDIRIRESLELWPGDFALASSIERFAIPNDIMPRLVDKSTWARRGLSLFNTTAEPGWRGFWTIELVNHGPGPIAIAAGMPIAQVVFQRLDEPTEQPYASKYQDQPPRPVPAISEGDR